LCICADQSNIKVATILIANGANVNAVDAKGWSALFYAVYNDDIDMIELLFSVKNLQLNIRDTNYKWTALVYATDETIFNRLVSGGANVNIQSKGGFSLLGYAVDREDFEQIDRLAKAGANIDLGGHSPLNLAIKSRNVTMIADLLIKYQANPNHTDGEGNSPMVEAVKRGTPYIFQLLIDHGGKITNSTLYEATQRDCKEILSIIFDQNLTTIKVSPTNIEELIQTIKSKNLVLAYLRLSKNTPIGHKDISNAFTRLVTTVLNANDPLLTQLFQKRVNRIPINDNKTRAVKYMETIFSLAQIDH